ncbi:MAG: chemotaxis protein CheW [Candidatus Nanohalobium sp.]
MTDERQVFVFVLNGEEYAVDVNNVKEIIRAEEKDVTSVPNVPDFIEGITNVRGQAVPLIDLEKKFDLRNEENNYIVIIELEEATAGLLADDVKEVMKLSSEKVKDAPEIVEEEIHRKYVDAVGVLEDRMIIILDLSVGLEDSEALEMKEINEEMSEEQDEEEEDTGEVSEDEVKQKARERVSRDEDEDKEDENDEETSDDSQEAFECDECGDTFDTKRGLASHKAQAH